MTTLDDARRVIAAAEANAASIGQPMNIAAADEGGISSLMFEWMELGSAEGLYFKIDITTKDLATHSQSGDRFFEYMPPMAVAS